MGERAALPAGQGTRSQGSSLCRRNGKVGLSGMAIADITLLSGFHALRADLEKVGSCPQEPLQVTLCGRLPETLSFSAADIPL